MIRFNRDEKIYVIYHHKTGQMFENKVVSIPT